MMTMQIYQRDCQRLFVANAMIFHKVGRESWRISYRGAEEMKTLIEKIIEKIDLYERYYKSTVASDNPYLAKINVLHEVKALVQQEYARITYELEVKKTKEYNLFLELINSSDVTNRLRAKEAGDAYTDAISIVKGENVSG